MMSKYRNGGEGFIRWMEDKVRLPIIPFGSDMTTWTPVGKLPSKKHPETGKSYKQMWEAQQEICLEALRMKNNNFIHSLIVFCWPRGEGKSLLLCCIKLWRFFEFARQKIVCSANSKDQVKFVHFDTMRDIILNSPELVSEIGANNIKEKGIFYKDSRGRIQSSIQTISTFSGIVSNITGYTFSEMFEQKNSDFFVRIDGSIRVTPNAMGGIDSTVSTKGHILYKLYKAFLTKEDPTIYFSYRCSKKGDLEDYWNPNMTKAQLKSYRIKFPFGDFERFFLNLWEVSGGKVFTQEMIDATNYLGVDHHINTQNELLELITKRNKAMEQETKFIEAGLPVSTNIINDIDRRLWPVEDIIKLRTDQNRSKFPEMKNLEDLSEIFDTNWALLAGLDRADPMSQRTSARTIVVAVAKGLIGSRSFPFQIIDGENPPYLYITIHVGHIEDDSLEEIKRHLQKLHEELEGLDTLGGERYGAWDLAPWCEDRNIKLELWQAVYERQKAIFTEIYNSIKIGRFLVPPLAVPGSRENDIFKEEALMFDHKPPEAGKKVGWFGSPEKYEKNGVQDDSLFAIGGAVYSGRMLSPLDFKERKGKIDFGSFFPNINLFGDYR
jgi:hypothetical protein